MKIYRGVQDLIKKRIGQNKVLLLFGTRRAGKTYLIKSIEKNLNIEYTFKCRRGKSIRK